MLIHIWEIDSTSPCPKDISWPCHPCSILTAPRPAQDAPKAHLGNRVWLLIETTGCELLGSPSKVWWSPWHINVAGAPTMVSATTGMDPIQYHVGPLDRHDTMRMFDFVLICIDLPLFISSTKITENCFMVWSLLRCLRNRKPDASCHAKEKLWQRRLSSSLLGQSVLNSGLDK